MAKKQKIDKLAQEAEMAKAAGMSYGKWKAMQDHVKYEKPTDCELVVCKYCGKQFKPKVKKRQIYCDIYCQKKAQYAARRKRLLGSASAYHDPAKYDVFNCFFDAEFQGNVQGRVLGLGALPDIPENSDLNDYKDFGAWAITTDEIAATITNIPEGKAGTLRVWSANGIGSATTGSNIYMLQEYVPYDNYCSWRRAMQLTGDSWVYGTWKVISGIDVVVEQGVTGNWYWRKFASGTAECWRRVSQTKNITTAWNAMYYADCDEVTFPFEFTNNPIVSASVESSNMLILCSYGNINTTKPANLRVARFGSAEGISFTIVYHAIGRWK